MLADGANIGPGLCVLDVATGTGFLAFEAARWVGRAGSVLGVDIFRGMLAEARRKAAERDTQNVEFILGDAERLDLADASFDRLTCASSLVLMSDIPGTLRHWSRFLKPGGIIAFDMPARPFGISGVIAEAASRHGVHLRYADAADTPDRCRSLLEQTGYEVVAVTTELADTAPVDLGAAFSFWDSHLDHPAWQALKAAPPATRDAIRSCYVERVTASAVGGRVPNDTALNLAFGRRPS